MRISALFIFIFSFINTQVVSQIYPDQHITLSREGLISAIDESHNLNIDNSDHSITLLSGETSGYFETVPMEFDSPFNHGLPSWNGTAPETYASFKIQMSFEVNETWSSWVTVGFWDNNVWGNYGSTYFTGGQVSIDEVKLTQYVTKAKFKVLFHRNSTSYRSPSLHQLSLFVSDTKTTDNVNISEIVNDKPPAIFIPTEFVHQYSVDSQIGGRICSPSSTAMILMSYDIDVDVYDFAVRTLDTYWDLFGVWPRNVQHASEYALNGSVTRYRDWSSAYEVLDKGGRIAMSLGPPLFSGHLVMLAGFDASGNPLVHNPASTNGYGQKYNNTDIAKSWFNKGGISYTMYPDDFTPEAPVIHSPTQDQEFYLDSPVEVKWSKLSRVIGYQVELSTDSEKTNIIQSAAKNSKSDTTIVFNSLPAGEYYVNVAGSKIYGTGNWTQTKFIVDEIVGFGDDQLNTRKLSVAYLNSSEVLVKLNTTGLDSYSIKMYDLLGHELTLPASNTQKSIETYLLNRNALPSMSIIVLESSGGVEYIKIPGL